MDKSGPTDHGVYHSHRIRTRKIGDKWAFSVDNVRFQTGNWKDERATVVAAMDCITKTIAPMEVP